MGKTLGTMFTMTTYGTHGCVATSEGGLKMAS